MTKEQILEAGKWDTELKALQKKLTEHKAKCLHWSVGKTWSEPHHDPLFPDDDYRKCDFCGKVNRIGWDNWT